MSLLLWMAMGVPVDDIHVVSQTCPNHYAISPRAEPGSLELFGVGRGWRRAAATVGDDGAIRVDHVAPCVSNRLLLALHSTHGVLSVDERLLDQRSQEQFLAFIQRERRMQLFENNIVRVFRVEGALEIAWVVSWMDELAMSVGIITDDRERRVAIDGVVDLIGAVQLDTGNIALVLKHGEAITVEEMVEGELLLRKVLKR